jgi:hypothetical protein
MTLAYPLRAKTNSVVDDVARLEVLLVSPASGVVPGSAIDWISRRPVTTTERSVSCASD